MTGPDVLGPSVRTRKDGAVAWLTLFRPPEHKLDLALARMLYDALLEADRDDAVAAIILTGDGEVFCGGADVPAVTAAGTLHEFSEALVELFALFPELSTPVVAAVNGDALAGGFGLLCSADVVVAVEGAQVGTIEALFGSWPAIAQVAALRRTPFPALLRNALTGVPFSAERAAELGVVDLVVPADELHAQATELAGAITAGAVALGRPALYRARELPYRDALRAGAEDFVRLAERP